MSRNLSDIFLISLKRISTKWKACKLRVVPGYNAKWQWKLLWKWGNQNLERWGAYIRKLRYLQIQETRNRQMEISVKFMSRAEQMPGGFKSLHGAQAARKWYCPILVHNTPDLGTKINKSIAESRGSIIQVPSHLVLLEQPHYAGSHCSLLPKGQLCKNDPTNEIR